jgi:hypothetical protein
MEPSSRKGDAVSRIQNVYTYEDKRCNTFFKVVQEKLKAKSSKIPQEQNKQTTQTIA